ncbi:PhzF family phenazine biosynthesis protein [Pseudoalteromonas aurantia]|uniref:PhzF family phenazine biosynthesis protein n=1 Tax=Pseudoalteromonas aurantia TaxID=43654 RepID=UPI0020165FA8|nr:PhzF family phenazine biosynthesis protein [Pseudoalteromonas aurantia]
MLKNITVELVNAFTAKGQGGNPAGVVLNAAQLSDEQKLTIAQTVGYSETAFVCEDDIADYAVSFFTTAGEVDFCGHATLATFSIMFQKGLLKSGIYTQHTKAGILPVVIESNGRVVMEQQLPQKLARFSYQEIASYLGIESNVLGSTELPIEVISTGLPDLIIPVSSGYLDILVPDHEKIAQFCKAHDIIGFHVFELCDSNSPVTASCRNFAPLFGIPEESATGSASGALACYLHEHLALDGEYSFEQGRAMNCSSLITVSIEAQRSLVNSVKVGGFAKSKGWMTVPI